MKIDIGEDPKKVVLNHSAFYKLRMETFLSVASKVKESCVPTPKGIVHWDGKLMDTLSTGSGMEKRLPILLSVEGGVKLQIFPAIPPKSSKKIEPQIGKATKDHLQASVCADRTIGMVFDKTKSNTRGITAGGISVQLELNHPLMVGMLPTHWRSHPMLHFASTHLIAKYCTLQDTTIMICLLLCLY